MGGELNLINLMPLIVWSAVEDDLGKAIERTDSNGQRWRVQPWGESLWLCVPNGQGGWCSSMDCRGSMGWEEYLRLYESAWPGVYEGPREGKPREGLYVG